ncbi:pyruvate ferredoxin oxidoreductase [archaeon]|nr:pyruvate ferredoxin oxidoreductase [archaeon]
MEHLASGNETAAIAAKMSRASCMPVFPITPQTEIIETLARWKANGELNAEFFTMDSEHSVMSAAVGCSATGARTFTATSSQGLTLMNEILFIASGMRLPIVMANVSRGLSAPITLWSDHTDFLNQKGDGWVQVHAQDNQEVFDSLVMAFKISEDRKVLLPSMVNLDGYVLSYTKEPIDVPTQKEIDKFLPPYKPKHAFFKPNKPLIQGAAVLKPEAYTYFRGQHHLANLNALEVIQEVCKDFKKKFGRDYGNGLIEEYKTNDADVIIVTQGSISTTAKAAVNEMRKGGRRKTKVGLLRLRTITPWPHKEVAKALQGAKHIAVFEKNVSPGRGGLMMSDLKASLYDHTKKKPIITEFVMGLGGSPESIQMFKHGVKLAKKDRKGEVHWLG